jgi:hypothetical protein
MGFDLGNFINNTSQSIAQRAVSAVTNKVDGAFGGNGVAGLLSGILSSGASLSTIASIASIGADRLIGQLEDEFFGAIGLTTNTSRLPGKTLQDTDIINFAAGGSKLQFPADLGVYGISFTFAKYHRPSPLVKSTDAITKAIYLPLPRELTSGHSIGYSATEGGMVSGVVDAAYQSLNDDSKDKIASISKRAGILAGVSTVGAATGVVDGLVGTSTGASLGQVLGAVPNPNSTVAYNGPTLRTFHFSWSFSPNNAKESDTLAAIFNELYKRSLGAFTESGSSALLSYPEYVNINVFPKGKGKIGDLMKFKKSMVTGIQINNAPNGIPSFFKGTQSPTFFDVQISFQEIEYFVSSDYGGTDAAGFSSDVGAAFGAITKGLDATFAGASAALNEAINGFDGSSFSTVGSLNKPQEHPEVHK